MEAMMNPRAGTASADAVAGAAAGKSAASWAAIIAGAVVAVAASLILLALGSGLGFAALSPWADHGVSATTFTVTTAIWLIVTQWISAGLGGYLAGRLRTRWIGTHSHEVFFRDTAHGLVTWAVATIVAAALVAASALSLAGAGVHAASAAVSAGATAVSAGAQETTGAQGTAPGASAPGPSAFAASYGTDKLFRTAAPAEGAPSVQDLRAEAGRIMANAISAGSVPDADRRYLADLIAAKTGLSQAEARARVDEWVSMGMEAQTKAKAAADAARKAASQASIYTALSLLVGAFIASISAALGGKLRDEHP
jgi:hypothetical protein